MSGPFREVVDGLVEILERCQVALAADNNIEDGDDLQIRRWGRHTISIHPAAWFEQQDGENEHPDPCSVINQLRFDLRFSVAPDIDGDTGDYGRLELIVDAVLPVIDQALRDRVVARCPGWRAPGFRLGREPFGDAMVGVLTVPVRLDWRTAIPDTP